MTRSGQLSIGIILTGLLLSALQLAYQPNPAAAQEPVDRHAMARAAYRQGQALANLLRWEDALPHMQRSFDTYPNATNTYALARTLHALLRFSESSDLFALFLANYPTANPAVRAAAQVYSEDIEARRRYIRLRGDMSPTASLRINGRLLDPASPSEGLLIVYDSDVHISVATPDGRRFDWTGTVLVGDTASIAIELRARDNPSRRRRLLWGLIGGALVAGAATAGILAYANQAGLSPQSDRVIRLQP